MQNCKCTDADKECNCQNKYAYGAYQEEEEEELSGARGAGCQCKYDECMMGIEEYLAIMLGWQEGRFKQYCMYCEECMFDV